MARTGQDARARRNWRVVGGAALASVFCAGPAPAETVELEEIFVTSPSPIVDERRTASDGASAPGVLPVIDQAFSAMTVTPRSEIVRAQPKTLADALSDRPGIAGSGFAPGAADRPIIRGLDGPRVRILENGLGVHDVSALGEDHAVPINPLVDDRVEVIRGPATLRFGSAAIGGVVSAENQRVPAFEPPGGFSADALAGLSSVDGGRDAAVRMQAGADGVVIHADGFRSRSGDYDTPDGRQDNSAARATGGSVGLSRVYDSGFFGVAYSRYESLYHVPGGEAAELNTRLDPEQDKLQARGEHRFDGGPFEAVRFWVNGSRYRHRELGLEHEHEDEHGHEHHDHDGHGHEHGEDGVHAVFRNRETEGRVELQHRPAALAFGMVTGVLGVQAGYRELRTSGEAGSLIAPTDSRNVAAYVFEEIDFGGGFRVQGAGRIERASVDGAATIFPGLTPDGSPLETEKRDRSFSPVSASLAALQSLPHGFVASVSGRYSERAPAALELFSRGSHHAQGLFEIGDSDLELERATSLEVGLRRAEGLLRFDASAYVTRFDGFIYRRLTGVKCGHDFDSCGVEDEFDQSVYSQRDATFRGAEIAAQLDAFRFSRSTLGFDASYDFVRATLSGGSNVPRIPPHRLGGGVYWRHDEGLFLKVGLTHAFAQNRTAEFETRTPGYDRLKAEASWTRRFDEPGARLKEVTLGIAGDNLLDERIRNAASFKKDEILLPGANVRAFVAARF
ncbi:TonB-dependent receptor [Hansschlegelia zhihuaiae]|uniref:TonB-dependent receptor n=1 Tax=Hansschlegelia zhihuaiae TaxID=405005 RepID=A0A4Q0MIS5_9HYPH|nr:TonB-dependent receptor [Hansschlegelia zhihuaiae]RXF73424.1 TonB-dependent receptor [Hansschlegelia zhihuaiae]